MAAAHDTPDPLADGAGDLAALTAIIVAVPAVEALVADLRGRLDPSAQLGVPAHVTVLYPFMPPGQVSAPVLERLSDAVADVPAFDFVLARAAGFAATAYLAPQPPEPFVRLTEAIVRAFPAYPPFRGEHARIVPHLTVAHGDAAAARAAVAELDRRLRAHGPIAARCHRLDLIENRSGRWRALHALALPDP